MVSFGRPKIGSPGRGFGLALSRFVDVFGACGRAYKYAWLHVATLWKIPGVYLLLTRANMMTGSARKHLTLNGTDVHYTSSGDQSNRLAVLLHGLGGSQDTFRGLISFIPPSYQTISIDIEGFGQTPLNLEKPPSFARYVADLHDLLAHIKEYPQRSTSAPAGNTTTTSRDSDDNRILLVGHSLGGIISLHYAAQYPTEVAGVLLLGVGRSIRGIPPAQQRMRGLARTAREQGMTTVAEIAVSTNFPADRDNSRADEQEVRDAVSSCSAEAYAATAEAVASDEHYDPDYSLINCPAVFVAGDKDMISPPQRSKDVASLIGGPSEVVVVKSGHQMILQDIDGVRRALERLIAMM